MAHSSSELSPHNPVWNFETVCFKVCMYSTIKDNGTMPITNLEVENELFTVFKKGLLVPGSVFIDMFTVPPGPQQIEGKDANNPIVLHGAKASLFSAFLSVLYPWVDGSVKLEKQEENVVFGVLRLANMWAFPEVRNQAIAVASGFSPFKNPSNNHDFAEMIRLGEEYLVQQWALAGYSEIILKRGLNFGDLEKDPYNFNQAVANKILYLKVIHGPGREHACTGKCRWGCRGYETNASDLQTAMKEFLGAELARTLFVADDRGSLN